MAKRPISYAVIRGKVIESDLIEFGGRGGDLTFLAPDPHKIADRIPLASPRLMEDLYEISFEDILDYLAELGEQLDIRKNDYLLEAREYSYATAPTTKPIMDSFFHDMPFMFDKERIRGMVDFNIGIPYLKAGSASRSMDRTSPFAPTAHARCTSWPGMARCSARSRSCAAR